MFSRCVGLWIAVRYGVLPGALLALAAGNGAAQTGAGLLAPLPPDAPINLKRMYHGSPADARPAFRIALPPVAGVSVRDRDLGEFSPVARVLRALVEDAVRNASQPVRGKRRVAQRGRRRALAQQIRAFYQQASFAPIWIADRQWTRAGRSVLTRLQRASEDALELGIELPPAIGPNPADAKAVAAADLQLSQAVVRYARFARGARVDPLRISRLITVKRDIPAAEDVLKKVSGAEFAGDALHGYNPPHRGYVALRAKLAQIRGDADVEPHPPIAHGRTLRVGMRDSRVPLIRLRFGLSSAGDAKNATLYDTRVAGAVARFQRSRGLPANGRLTRATIAALSNNTRSRLINEVIANMERWRWLPQDLGQTHIIVNVPEYMVRVFRDGREIHSARAIVGKPKTPTPIFSDVMEYVVVNPYWNVPQSIIKNEMLPAYQRDPGYFVRKGYEVRAVGDRLVVRQPPGPRNALGFVKLLFPNRHAVYMHDTPSRRLFGAGRRAFSHGCVRVQDPFKLAGLALAGQKGWSEARLRRMIGGDERTIRMRRKIPVHLVYFTALIDESGELRLMNDVYGHSTRVRRALGLRG